MYIHYMLITTSFFGIFGFNSAIRKRLGQFVKRIDQFEKQHPHKIQQQMQLERQMLPILQRVQQLLTKPFLHLFRRLELQQLQKRQYARSLL
jgi:hypothetical protein